MIESWYYSFLACVVVLWAFSVPQDRNALRIILFFSLTGIALVTWVTPHLQGFWKTCAMCSHEALTILCLLFANTQTSYRQAVLLFVSWLANLLCYIHLKTGGQLPFFYDNYETIIQVVAVWQLAACYDTLRSLPLRIYHALKSLGVGSGWVAPDAAIRSAVFHGEGTNQNQTGQ